MSINKATDIFIKRSEIESDEESDRYDGSTDSKNIAISRKEIINMIPKNCSKQKNTELAKTKTEWRWRVFKLPNKDNESIEISLKHPDEERKYIDKNGSWVNCKVSEEFDAYVTCEYYHYA